VRWRRPRPHSDGAAAREDAEKALEETRARWPEVREQAESLRQLRRENHFAAMLIHTIRGH
jgi:hypothetical protein